ncbi:methyltransferase-like protein 9 isoform X3 [Leptotrombidium deliense]|uniref:Methyltransferase-like protein 9 isoform X3 n=1 Tax=Leptotrombidium deliense TaxID=299467 RepID=A0A443SF21_9ACAR|nr:methyltransferase-like protein 9 isoform X3 [Leptotrombidium deliense]
MFIFSDQQINKLCENLPNFKSDENSALLDLGAGDGAVTQVLSSYFNSTYVTEVSPVMRRILTKRGYSVLDAYHWHKESMNFDLICCLNLLDRCDRPLTMLQRIRSKLKPNGIVLLAVVFPFSQYVESSANKHKATESLPITGQTLEEQLVSFHDNVIVPSGFEVVKWTKLPYLYIAYAYETDDITLAIINVSYVDPTTGVFRNEREEIGKFSIGKIGSVNGVVVHLNGNDACDPIDGKLWPSEPWIALTQYGHCTETQKLRNIANTNASAAVMYDAKPAPKVLRVNQKAIDLISVFISKEKGEEIGLLVNNGTRSCVDPWLLDQRSCPMCKLDILKHYGIMCEMMSQESVFNIDEFEIQQQYWRNHYGRGSGEIEIVHIPINNHSHQATRSERNCFDEVNSSRPDPLACNSTESESQTVQVCLQSSCEPQATEDIKIAVEKHDLSQLHPSSPVKQPE